MGEDFLTSMTLDNNDIFLSMVPIHNPYEESESDRDMNRAVFLSGPLDINLPLSVEPSPPHHSWYNDDESFDVFESGIGRHQPNESSDTSHNMSKSERKCAKRSDSIWGAWFFFSFYFKPVLKDEAKCNVVCDGNGVSGFDKSDLKLDVFMVQHDMENLYMWVFKERPDNALGIMQLRSYMNGNSRLGERPFPFNGDKGFVRSHRMQRKQYRGLSNPQCVHGIEFVSSPNLMIISDEEQKKWMELTGRDLSFTVPPEARDFSLWRNIPLMEFDLEKPPPVLKNNNHVPRKVLNGGGLNLSTQSTNHVNGNGVELSRVSNKRRRDLTLNGNDDGNCCFTATKRVDKGQDMELHSLEPSWMKEFSGVMNKSGPAAGAKSIYEDEEGYLIIVDLPFSDMGSIKIHWSNNPTHGVVKISCWSMGCKPLVQREGRTFKLTDPSPEHCPTGTFKREIPLATLIPADAKVKASFDSSRTVLEIMVPKPREEPEEHEVCVTLRPPSEFL